jgi:hypothetical protein
MLPDELWREVWAGLTVTERFALERVSSHWKRGMAYGTPWRALTRRPPPAEPRTMWRRLLHPVPRCLLCGENSIMPFLLVQCPCTAPTVQRFHLGCCMEQLPASLHMVQPGWLVFCRCYLCQRHTCIGLCRWELLTL